MTSRFFQAMVAYLNTKNITAAALAIRPPHRRYQGWWRYGPNTGCRRGYTDVLAEELGSEISEWLTCVIDTESAKWAPTAHAMDALVVRRVFWEKKFRKATKNLGTMACLYNRGDK